MTSQTYDIVDMCESLRRLENWRRREYRLAESTGRLDQTFPRYRDLKHMAYRKWQTARES